MEVELLRNEVRLVVPREGLSEATCLNLDLNCGGQFIDLSIAIWVGTVELQVALSAIVNPIIQINWRLFLATVAKIVLGGVQRGPVSTLLTVVSGSTERQSGQSRR